MNIKQGLKEKNKLVKKVTELMERTNRFNSIDEGGIRSYDPKDSMSQAVETMEELINLKTSIHKANLPVYEKIFRMSEYKSFVKYLKSLNCNQGTVVSRGYGEVTTRQLSTVITEVERDQMIEKYESMIEEIQSELDNHNATAQL